MADTLTNQDADFIVITEANKRIRQLEKLNATLAAEVDRMRPLVEAVLPWRYTLHLHRLDTIVEALDNYNTTQPK